MSGNDVQQLNERFQAEGAGPNRILIKVSFEEPVGRVHPFAPANVAKPKRPAVWDEKFDVIRHPELVVGERRLPRDRKGLTAADLSGTRTVGFGIAQAHLLCERVFGEKPKIGVSLVDRAFASHNAKIE